MPVFQSFQAAFPESLLAPGNSKLLVRLEDPFSHAPISGTVRVYLEGEGRRRFEIGSGQVRGTGTVPFSLPKMNLGGWGMIARVEGARAPEEISVENVDVGMADQVQICTEKFLYAPGETVRFMGLARHNDDPPRPAAGEPWILKVSSPSGVSLQTLMGTTGPGGSFQGSFTLPFSARPGFYSMDVRVGPRIFGYMEVKVPMEQDPFRVRPIHLHRAVGGQPFTGELEITFHDGRSFSGARVRVVLVKGGRDVKEAPCSLVGPGLYRYTMDLPPLGKGEEEPLPLTLEARIGRPGGVPDASITFDKIFLYRSAYRIVVEAPYRWVPGMPHRVRAVLVDRTDRAVPAEIRVLSGEDGSLLGRASYPGKGAAVIDFRFPERSRTLTFEARGKNGRVLARHRVKCKFPENKEQGLSLVLEKSVLREGEDLKVTVYDKRKEDRLWVDLLLEGMVKEVHPLQVKEGKGELTVPFLELPKGLFNVRVWRWEGNPPAMHQTACLALGGGSAAVRASWESAGKGIRVGSGFPGGDGLLCAGRPGTFNPYDIPGPERVVLSIVPGTFGFSDPDLHRLARAWRDGFPLPETREDLAPFLRDSWNDGNGPGRLVEARFEEKLGWLVLLVGVLVGALGTALSLFVFSREKKAFLRRQARTGALVLLSFGLALGASRAQEPPPGNPRGEPSSQAGEPSEGEDLLEVFPFKPDPWVWNLVSPKPGKPVGLGPFHPALPGPQTLCFAGQVPGKGGILFSWNEFTWNPPLELHWSLSGTIWPGDEWKIPLWVRLSRGGPESLRPFLTGGAGPAGRLVQFRGKGKWNRLMVSLTYADVAAKRKLRILDRGGKVLSESGLPFHPPLKEAGIVSWSAPLGGVLEKAPDFGPGGFERRGWKVLAFAHPLDMALAHLDRTKGDPLSSGSLDQVLGRARTALAVLEVLRRSSDLPGERKKNAAVKALGHLMDAWREIAGYRNIVGGYADFPGAVDEISPTAEALAFLGRAKEYLPLGGGRLLRRVRKWLWSKVKDDGRVLPDPGFLADEVWKETGGGGLFITSQVERALAAVKSEVYYLKRTEDVILLDLKGNPPPFVRIEAARALLARDPRNPLGLETLRKCALLVGDRNSGVRAGFTDWTGAEGARADLIASARLAAALARAGIAPEKAALLRAYILDRVRPDLGFGDEWTTGACYEALLAPKEALEPAGELEVTLRVGGEGLAQRKGGPFLEIDFPPLKAGKDGKIRVETKGRAPLGAVILLGRKLLDPGRAFKKGPLILDLALQAKASASLETPLKCLLSVGNEYSRSLARVVVRIPYTGAMTLLPGGLLRAVEQGRAARVYLGKDSALIWFTHFPPVFTRKIPLYFLPHVVGLCHLPPVRVWVTFQDELEARTAPLQVVVGS